MLTLRRLWLLPIFTLLLPLWACQGITLPGPEDAATDAFGTPPASRTPKPTRTPQPTRAVTAGLTDTVDSFAAALRPEFAADANSLAAATRYTIEVTLELYAEDAATLRGREQVGYTNVYSTALNEIYLMLWPNDDHSGQYLSDMSLQQVQINTVAVEPELDPNGIAVRLPLAQPLAPGESITLSAEFTVHAEGGVDTLGAARFGLTHGVLLAPTFYPLIPRRVAGAWQIQAAPSSGDTTNSDSAFYRWQVTAPADLAIVATGTVVAETSQGETRTQTIVAGPVRDLALVVGPLELTQREVDGITVNAYMLADHADLAEAMLDYTAGQIETLQKWVGPYPFAELDVVDAPGAFGGIEYPGLVFIGVVAPEDTFFEEATVHEAGHQWFYSVVGDDQLLEPWLDEAAASYTEVLYAENIQGAQTARGKLMMLKAYLEIASDSTLPIGRPVADYASLDYGIIVYKKGALFFAALREQLGDETFGRFLQTYYARYRYGFATAADFQHTAEETCGCDLQDLFELWVYTGGERP